MLVMKISYELLDILDADSFLDLTKSQKTRTYQDPPPKAQREVSNTRRDSKSLKAPGVAEILLLTIGLVTGNTKRVAEFYGLW